MYLADSIPGSKIDITGDWSHIRFGDAIGMAALANSLGFHYGRNVTFYHEPKFPTVDKVFRYTPELLVRGKVNTKLTSLRASCWAHWEYNVRYWDQHLYLKNPHIKEIGKNRVVINPIFDAPYNRDRNWTPELFKSLVAWYLEHGWKVTVTGVERVVEPWLAQVPHNLAVKRLYDDVGASMRAVCTCDVYIGGDTGMTHFAAAMEHAPRRMIAIFGDQSDFRHGKNCKDFVNIVEYDKCPDIRNTFVPKVNKHKRLLYTLQKDFNFEEMSNFLVQTSTFDFKSKIDLDAVQNPDLKGSKRQKKVLAFFDAWNEDVKDVARIAQGGYIVVPTRAQKIEVDQRLHAFSLDSADLKVCACLEQDFLTIFNRRPYRFNLGVDNGMDSAVSDRLKEYSADWVVLK